jgi:hypothetical protein
VNDFSNARNTTDTANEEREPAPQETRADTAPDPAPAGFRATWARTANNARIGKIKKPSGKWPPTPGAQSLSYIFEVREYPSIVAFWVDYEARMKSGIWALVAGKPRPKLDPRKPHRRVGANFIDAASTKFTIDFDGLEPDDPDTPIDGVGAYAEDDVFLVARVRLPKAFKQATCMVSATSSTGSNIISTGKPSEGKARFRGTWETSRALTCRQQEKLAKALKALPGLKCIDSGFYSLAHFDFITRPVFLEGETDPIKDPVYLLEGGLLDIDAVCAELEIDLDASGDDQSRSGGASPGSERPQTGKTGLALDLPPEQAEPLLRALLTAIGNGPRLRDGYKEWFGIIAAIFNASKGADWGLEIAVEWTASGGYDTKEVDDKWQRLQEVNDGRNGIDNLIRLAAALMKDEKVEAAAGSAAAKAKAEELDAAVSGIDRARAAATTFPDDDPDPAGPDDNELDEMDEALLASRMPAIDPKAFYGPLREIIEAATKNSEATKIGVALQTIAHTATSLRPFCIPLGDGPICLNLFLLQIGFSSVARKGTSSAFADNFVGPAIQALARELRQSSSGIALDCAAREDARRAVEEAEHDADRARLLTDANAGEAATQVAKLKREKADAENAIASWRNKLAAKPYALATQKDYERAIKQKESRISELEPLIRGADAEHARIVTVLTDRAAAIAAAHAALAQAQANEAAIPAPQTQEPWLELFMALEEPPAPMTGVSSGEGIIDKIRDARPASGARDDKGDRGVREKRLFINLSEFGVVLAQIRRTGSTLSTTLRDAYDCVPMMTGSKNSPSRVEQPYVNISAAITPAEFVRATFEDREATSADNGLTNRFLTVYVAREKLVACPLPTEGRKLLARGLAENILKVYRDCKPTEPFQHTPIEFTPEALALYDEGGVYKRIATLSGASSRAGKLLARSATNFRKLAAVLAIMNGESRVSVGALEAAVAWIEYSEASADTITTTISERRRHTKLKADGETVLAALKALGGATQAVPSREVRRKTGFDEKQFQAAIGFIDSRPPSPIEIVEQEWVSGNRTVRKRALLKLTQLPEKTAQTTQQQGPEPSSQQEPTEETAPAKEEDKPSSPCSFPSEEEPV